MDVLIITYKSVRWRHTLRTVRTRVKFMWKFQHTFSLPRWKTRKTSQKIKTVVFFVGDIWTYGHQLVFLFRSCVRFHRFFFIFSSRWSGDHQMIRYALSCHQIKIKIALQCQLNAIFCISLEVLLAYSSLFSQKAAIWQALISPFWLTSPSGTVV